MGLLAIAAVPLVAIAAIAAWQNYVASTAQPGQMVQLAREAVLARHEAAIETVRQTLIAIAQSDPVLDAKACAAYLARIYGSSGGIYTRLQVVVAHVVTCEAPPPADGANRLGDAGAALVASAKATRDLAISLMPSSDESVGAAFPITRSGQVLGVVIADWRIDRFVGRVPLGTPASVWLVDDAGRTLPIQNAADGALPAPGTLAALQLGEREEVQAASRSGAAYAYASARLADGWRVLVGMDAGAVLASGRALLLARFFETAVLLLIGLMAVGVSVNSAVVAPIKNLTRAVRSWRGGASFTPGNLSGVPSEVAELSVSFFQATSRLADRETQLRNALTHQDLLMHEIHHRVKNNLQIVASLLNLQASRIRQPEAKAEFQSARDRIRALATLHRHLYSEGGLQTINMRSFLTELCGQLFQAFGETEGERISLDIEAPELVMSSDQAVPLALIVTETVSNALKYAFPRGRQGTISVRLFEEPAIVRLVIRDDGVGIPPGRAETDAGVRDGIGIQLIRGFARQLAARLIVEEGEGIRYDVEIPFHAGHPGGQGDEAEPVAV